MYIMVEEGLLIAKVMFASQGFSVHLAPPMDGKQSGPTPLTSKDDYVLCFKEWRLLGVIHHWCNFEII